MENKLINSSSFLDSVNIESEANKIKTKYPDDKALNNIIISDNNKLIKDIKIICKSAKRSVYQNIEVENSDIINNAFCGTVFSNTAFKNNHIDGNSFISSNFYKFILESNNVTDYQANNFSNSYFNLCEFHNAKFLSSSWLNSTVVNSTFNDCIIQSCTMEGAVFNSCEFNNVIMHSANLDYMILKNTKLKKVVFPFYQFAYIIGIKEYLCSDLSEISFMANEKNISLKEYKDNIKGLICYYYDISEYFPVSNLLMVIGNMDEAKKMIILGISKALYNNDYRTVKLFCRLCKYNNLQTYDLIKSIKEKIDSHLLKLKSNNSNILNEALVQTAEISMILEERASNKLSLNFEIQTNIDRKDFKAQEKINNLIGDCKFIIDNSAFDNDGHTLTEISYCPTSLIFSIIGNISSLITISTALQQFIVYIKTKESKNTRKIAKDICKKYSNISVTDLDTKVELAKEKIKYAMLEIETYKGKKTGEDYNNFITGITQKIIGDIDEIVDKDLLVFKIED